jgi:hypothetical protein
MTEFSLTVDGWWPAEGSVPAQQEGWTDGALDPETGEMRDPDRFRYHKRLVEHREEDRAAPLLQAMLGGLSRFEDDRGVSIENAVDLSVEVHRG